MAKGNHRSILKKFSHNFQVITLLLIVAVIGVFFSLFKVLQGRMFEQVQSIVNICDSELTDGLKKDLSYTVQICQNNRDIISLVAEENVSRRYYYIVQAKNILDTYFSGNTTADGVFLYIPEQDVFITELSSSDNDVFNSIAQKHIHRMIESYAAGDNLYDIRCNSGVWIPYEMEDAVCFVSFVKSGAMYAGVWADASRFREFDMLYAIGADCYLVDQEMQTVLGHEEMGPLPAEKAISQPVMLTMSFWKRYFLISSRLSFSNCYLAVMLPYGYLLSYLFPYVMFAVGILIWFLVFYFFTLRLIKRTLILPVSSLDSIVVAVKNGEKNIQIESPYDYIEIENIVNAYNVMLHEIEDLKIDVYEEQLLRYDAEFQYYKSQIAPHFLINSLNVLLVAADASDKELTETIIRTLSNHIRYKFADRKTVSLKEEVEYLKNYYLLVQCRFPGCFRYRISVPSSLEKIMIYPYMLLTLSENSIKAGLVMGEAYQIRVWADTFLKDGEKYVKIVHEDSGPGVSAEQIALFNHILEHPEVVRDGKGIGIYNEAMRMSRIFGEKASIYFHCTAGTGLTVECTFPYTFYSD